jgi:hypothetical protein
VLHTFVTRGRRIVAVHFAHGIRTRHTEVEHREREDECDEASGHVWQFRRTGNKWKALPSGEHNTDIRNQGSRKHHDHAGK